MSDETTPQDSAAMPPASAGSVPMGSLSAFVAWRDEKLAKGEHDVNPYMVWCAGVRYATLTDAEREAIQAAIDRFRDWVNGTDDEEREVTLRGLLEQLK